MYVIVCIRFGSMQKILVIILDGFMSDGVISKFRLEMAYAT